MRHLAPIVTIASITIAATPVAAATNAMAGGNVTVSEVASFHYASPAAVLHEIFDSRSSNGDIVATAAHRREARRPCTVTSSGDAARARIVAREEGGGVVVCVLFADESPEACRMSGVSRSGSNRSHQNGPSIQLVARIPAGVSLTADTLNGTIRARGIGGEVRATTLNGDVDVSAATITEATTLSGNVDATFALPPTKNVEVTTNNGNVRVKLPSAIDADVEASTMNGTITSSFPMPLETTPGGFGPKSGHARLGKGGPKLEARSLNGNVDLKTGA